LLLGGLSNFLKQFERESKGKRAASLSQAPRGFGARLHGSPLSQRAKMA